MNVEEAIQARYSCRAFLPDKPVERHTVEHLLKVAAQAPSGGNLQPWQVIVLSGEALAALVADVKAQAETLPRGEETEYRIYPKDLKEPYFSRRHKCGEDLYATIGVAREDKQGRLKQYRRNMELFGAPVGLFVYLDRQMQPGQWSDAGMFIQTFMLAAAGQGLATCAQEFWAMCTRRSRCIRHRRTTGCCFAGLHWVTRIWMRQSTHCVQSAQKSQNSPFSRVFSWLKGMFITGSCAARHCPAN
jgi:nitroreductase